MAQAYKFYKIGEANAEISRLESELTKATARVTELEGIVSGNETELTKQLADKDSQISALTSERDTLKAEKQAADSKVKETEKSVDKAATEKATDILAATGLPKPLAVKPTADPASTVPQASELTGRDRFLASFKVS